MNTEGQTGQMTEEELFNEMSEALRSGDETSIAKLVTGDDVPDESATTDPATKVPEEEKGTETPAPTEATPPTDIEDGLPDEAKEYVRKLKEERDNLDRRYKSELGRVPHLQRELAKYQREMAEIKRNLQEPQPPATKVAPAPKQGKIAEKLAQLREIDPALAEVFEAFEEERLNPLREELGNEVNQVKNLFASKEEEKVWYAEKDKLLSKYPQADEIFKLPLWREWKETLTPSQYALASSMYADDVSVAIEQFARYAAQVRPELVTPPSAAQPPAATPTAPNPTAAKVEEDRKKKLAAKAPGTTAVSPRFGDGLPETEEELFEYYKNKIRKGEM